MPKGPKDEKRRADASAVMIAKAAIAKSSGRKTS
jgi:hypothetical protein